MPEVTACLAHAAGARQRWDGLQDGSRRTLRARQIKFSPGQSHRDPGRATQLSKKAETVLPSVIGLREAQAGPVALSTVGQTLILFRCIAV